MRKQRFGVVLAGVAFVAALVFGWAAWPHSTAASSQADEIQGKVYCAGSPITGSTVTLYAASDGKPWKAGCKDTEIVVNTIFDAMTEALKQGERIEIRGFGSFQVKVREAREGRNPKTGEEVQIPAKRTPFFKVGKELKEMVDGVPLASLQTNGDDDEST
jgi:integration host factor subunit beta